MEAYLMCGVFKFCQLPESCPGYFSINKILNIVKYCVICHWSFHNIIAMFFTWTALDNKIQPLFRHLRKFYNLFTSMKKNPLFLQHVWTSLFLCNNKYFKYKCLKNCFIITLKSFTFPSWSNQTHQSFLLIITNKNIK